MRTPPVLRTGLLAVAAGLVASCTAPAALPATPTAAATPPVAATPTVAATPQVAGPSSFAATQAPMVRPADTAASLLVVRVENPGPGASLTQQELGVLRARPVDPNTLEDIQGFTPLELGHHYRALLSPDGRTLATIVWPSGSTNTGGVLHFVDPLAWTVRTTDVQINEATTWLEWSKD